jgi:hypothetical protein
MVERGGGGMVERGGGGMVERGGGGMVLPGRDGILVVIFLYFSLRFFFILFFF